MAKAWTKARRAKASRAAKSRPRYKTGPKKGQFKPGGARKTARKPAKKRRKPAKKRSKPAKKAARRPAKKPSRRRGSRTTAPRRRGKTPPRDPSTGRFMRSNPSPLDVAVLNPDIVEAAKDIGLKGLGLSLGMFTGGVLHGLWEKYGAPRMNEGEPILPADLGTALISSGLPAAGGYISKKLGAERLGQGMYYGSAALFVVWVLGRIRSAIKGEEDGVGRYVKELDLGPLGQPAPALLLASQEAGNAMMQSAGGNLYSIKPATESIPWEIVYPDGSAIQGDYLGDASNEYGHQCHVIRAHANGEMIMLPVNVEASTAGEIRAMPLNGIVPDRLDGIVPDTRLDGIVPDTRLDGIVPDEQGMRGGMWEW